METYLQPPDRPKFPLSSPIADDHDSTYSSRSGNTYLSHNPFLTPNTNHAHYTDDASSDTSGHDEFHLERYSQAQERKERERKQALRPREQSPRTRPRPGLNIVTDFPSLAARSNGDTMMLDKVQTRRPRTASRAAPSIVSQKAIQEVMRPQEELLPTQRFLSLKDLAKVSQREGTVKNKLKSAMKPKKSSMRTLARGDVTEDETERNMNDQTESYNPRDDANSARTLQRHSPATPAIIVTPAQESFPATSAATNYSRGRARRPASSIYSQFIISDRRRRSPGHTPPMPDLPNEQGFILGPGRPPYPEEKNYRDLEERRQSRRGSTGTLFDDEEVEEVDYPDARMPTARRPGSSDSRDLILPDSTDTARPKSSGWWNLMLSPMLSRAGTMKSTRGVPAPTPVPPMPSRSPNEKLSPDYFGQVPGKPGSVDPRASTWSNWTMEREEEDFAADSGLKRDTEDSPAGDQSTQDSAMTVPFMIGATPAGQGLAREYYHACAIDARSDEPYFECVNHSCREGLPKLVSSHPRAAVAALPGLHTGGASREISPDPIFDEASSPAPIDSTTGIKRPVINREPTDFSPTIRQANFTPILKATPLRKGMPVAELMEVDEAIDEEPSKTASPLPSKSTSTPASAPPRPKLTKFPVMDRALTDDQEAPIASPGPLSPEMQRAMTSQGAVPMSEIRPAQPVPIFINNYTNYPEPTPQAKYDPVTFADLERPLAVRNKSEMRQRSLEGKGDEAPKKEKKKKRACCAGLGCFRSGGAEGKRWKRWYSLIFVLLLLIVIACVVLATQLTRRGDATPVQTQWLNLTGFPPMPTGISTVARPDPAVTQQGCIGLSTMWSCAVPKEDAAAIAPNDPDEPNFRFEIRFRNGSLPGNETASLPIAKRGSWAERHALLARRSDPFANALFTPSPAAPDTAEQIFLGNTTDNITAPFEGEPTPFFITFISSSPVLPPAFNSTPAIKARQANSNLTSVIPPPAIASDGTAAPANLLPSDPFPVSQPVRLYNRGQATEHYGFYSYYDKSIFLRSNAALNGTSGEPNGGVVDDDQNGGSTKSAAVVRCTWSQTRFLVRIWTNSGFGAALLSSPANTTGNNSNNNVNSSATDFTSPGSFPYPISIIIDRHGGDLNKKAVYCYGMNDRQQIEVDVKTLEAENRGAGGIVINQAPGLILPANNSSGSNGNNGGSAAFNASAGGIDGGTGGCACEWRNWISTQ